MRRHAGHRCSSLSEFTQRVPREATRRSFTQAQRQVVIGGGAPWIWKIAQELSPRAIRIVDKLPVKEHPGELAGVLCGAGSEQAGAWSARRHAEHSNEARKCFQHPHRNRERRRYPKFEAEGLCVGSGVVEARCKVVAGADAIMALRRSRLSGRFQDFWERRHAIAHHGQVGNLARRRSKVARRREHGSGARGK